jgi:hypothetical protein
MRLALGDLGAKYGGEIFSLRKLRTSGRRLPARALNPHVNSRTGYVWVHAQNKAQVAKLSNPATR